MFKFSRRGAVGVSLAAALLVGGSAVSAASQHRFTVRNVGSHTITSVYISDVDSGRWGRDQLGSDTIEPGYKYTWTWDGNCLQDVKVVFDNGRSLVESEYDTCNYDLRANY